ncbi:MAG: DUF423 domain-containing protein [Edaphocola sp.]
MNIFKPALNAAFIFAILGVSIGAMGAHALRASLTEAGQMDSFETAVKYQFYHSFALLFAGFLHTVFPSAWVRRATWMFVAGILLFSGSIYLLVYFHAAHVAFPRPMALLTPIGGVCFIVGWLFLLIGINSKGKTRG